MEPMEHSTVVGVHLCIPHPPYLELAQNLGGPHAAKPLASALRFPRFPLTREGESLILNDCTPSE